MIFSCIMPVRVQEEDLLLPVSCQVVGEQQDSSFGHCRGEHSWCWQFLITFAATCHSSHSQVQAQECTAAPQHSSASAASGASTCSSSRSSQSCGGTSHHGSTSTYCDAYSFFPDAAATPDVADAASDDAATASDGNAFPAVNIRFFLFIRVPTSDPTAGLRTVHQA